MLSIQGKAQNKKIANTFFEKAVYFYGEQNYKKAIFFAQKSIDKDSIFADPHILIGSIYHDKQDYYSAILEYKKGIQLDSVKFFKVFLTLAELKLKTKQFDLAIKDASKIINLENSSLELKKKADFIITTAKFRKRSLNNPIKVDKKKLKHSSIKKDEYINGVSLDGKSIFFTQKEQVEKGATDNIYHSEKIFCAELKDDSLVNINIFEPTEKIQERVGAASLSVDGRYLFFTICNGSMGRGSCDLYCASLTSEDKKVFNLGRNINTNEWESQPCFSADGKTLFFSSKRKGGFGGSDIWISTLNEEGYFSDPKNAGASINTVNDEMAPFIHADTRSLYFSSNGHPGMGGFDLFVSRRQENGNWSNAENLGYPINTDSDEINIIIAPQGDKAYLSAKKEVFDIYYFNLSEKNPEQVSYVYGFVMDEEKLSPLFAKIELIDLKTGITHATTHSYENDGHFMIPLTLNHSFAFHVSREGYLFYSENFNIKDFDNKKDTLLIVLKPIRIHEKVNLKNIFFETDQFNLLPESTIELKRLIQFLKNNPKLVIEIGGHTDNIGTLEYNLELSEKRAQTVYSFLIEKGVDAQRLSFMGFGEIEPISSNDTEEGRALNRRTEFKIMEIKN